MVSASPRRLSALLLALPMAVAAACQMLSGVDDLEVSFEQGGNGSGAGTGDAAAGTAGSSGVGGTSGASGEGGALGAGGSIGEGGASGDGGTLGEAGTSGEAGMSAAGGALGSSGTSTAGGTSGADAGSTGGTAGTAGAAGRGGTSGTGGSAGRGGSAGTSGSAGTGGSGPPPECRVATDCPAESNECAHRACVSGDCTLEPEPRNTVVSQQTAGDCKRRVCDGSGGIISINDDTDPKDDGKVCTKNLCSSGVPSNPPEPVNTPCGINTKCDGAGRCVGCTSSSDCPADTACTDWSCDSASGTCNSSPRSTSTPCGPAPSCSGGVERPQDYCDGAGACRDSGSRACSPLLCGATACLAACSADSDCVSGYFCSVSATGQIGGCKPKLSLGGTCGGSGQCNSGYCVDGVCCENGCTGFCNTCNGIDAGGLPPGYCFPVAFGKDPANECTGGRACNGQNGCTGVQQCDCGTPRYDSTQNCCSACSNAECPSQVNACIAANGTYCGMIGGVTNYRSGTGVPDDPAGAAECATGQRCGVVSCACVQ